LFGLFTGSLVGLLGGPVGLAVGASAGTLTGSLFDLARIGVTEDFLAEVSQNLTPGKLAVVADANEEWVTPVDTRMEALGGVVFRRARGEFIDAQFEREIAADEAELAQLRAEYNKGVGDVKAKLKAKLDTAQRKVEARRALLNQRIDAIQKEGEAKIKSLQEQAAKASGEMQTNLEQRIAKERADQKARLEKLRQAWRLVREAAMT
jgi:paraquat-inducible protein B